MNAGYVKMKFLPSYHDPDKLDNAFLIFEEELPQFVTLNYPIMRIAPTD